MKVTQALCVALSARFVHARMSFSHHYIKKSTTGLYYKQQGSGIDPSLLLRLDDMNKISYRDTCVVWCDVCGVYDTWASKTVALEKKSCTTHSNHTWIGCLQNWPTWKKKQQIINKSVQNFNIENFSCFKCITFFYLNIPNMMYHDINIISSYHRTVCTPRYKNTTHLIIHFSLTT